jgi:hypothetical protein
MQKRLAIFAVAMALLHGAMAHAEQTSQAHKGTSTGTPNARELLIQRERLELDKQKFASDANIENRKLDIEREKLHIEESTSRWSALSAVGPVTIALAALVFSVWSFLRQGKQQSAMQLEAAKLQFEIKAAELAFSGKTARAVANRAKALKTIFPVRLPGDFAEGFSPTDLVGNKEPSEEKKFFLELLLKYPEKKGEVFGLWEKLFPGDQDWLDRVKALT